MTLPNTFLQGLQTGIRQWRIAAIVYFLQLCLAMTVGIQVFEVLKASIGNSLEINKLLTNYDHTVITDFIKVHGASITPLIGQVRWLLLAWLFFSVFTNAGLLYTAAVPKEASWKVYWQSSAAYFRPFLKIALWFLVLTLVWTGLVFVPILMFLEPSLTYFSSEQYSVWLVLSLLGVWLVGLAVLYSWSVLSRLQHIKSGSSILKCIHNGWRRLQQNKLMVMVLLAGFAALQLLLATVYWSLVAYAGMSTLWLVILVFAFQQAYVFGRIILRQMMFAGMALVPEALNSIR